MRAKKDVFVRSYLRFRKGALERVCAHYRSHPGAQIQLQF